MTSDGSTTVTQFEEFEWDPVSGQDASARRLIPDGEGGVLAAWAKYDSSEYEYHIARITSSGLSDFTLPSGWGGSGYAPVEEMVLGEDGVAYATNLADLIAFDISSLQTVWSYEIPQEYPNGIRIIASAADGGLVAKLRDTSDADTVVRFDDEGTPTLDSWTGEEIEYRIGDIFFGSPSGVSTARYVAPFLRLNTASFFSPSMAQTNRADETITVTNFSRSEPNQTTIEGLVQELITATSTSTLSGSLNCKWWVESSSYGSNTVSQLQYILDNDYYGHGVVNQPGWINGAVTSIEIPNETVLTVVNDNGPFFNSGPRQGVPEYVANTPRARATILAHEFGHQLDLPTIEPDKGRRMAQWWNDLMVHTFCGLVIEGMPRIENPGGPGGGGSGGSGMSATSGAANSSVTITGFNFGSTVGTVTFNGVSATVSSWGDNGITVLVPTGGTGRVKVTDSQGITATGPVFTVTQ